MPLVVTTMPNLVRMLGWSLVGGGDGVLFHFQSGGSFPLTDSVFQR